MVETDNKQDLDAVLQKSKKVLVLFYASWCPYCMRFVPIFRRKIFGFDKISVVEVLLDDYDNPLWDDYSVGAVPTIILFEDGKVSTRLDGKLGSGLSEKQLDDWLKKANN